ncbi:MAG: hypothetical protein JSV44_02335 [Candidatus Zixiibacteriota bacterium]|nr:MAG: hypothetical protein JSV44_02335 [candidate division Zixibacteria bacterium]
MTEQKRGMSKGCLIGLIVVGVIAVVVIAMAIVCYVYKDELIDAGLTKMTDALAESIIENLPEGVSEDDVRTLMTEFKQAFKEGKISQEEIQEISGRFQKIAKQEEISQEESREIMEMIRRAIDE